MKGNLYKNYERDKKGDFLQQQKRDKKHDTYRFCFQCRPASFESGGASKRRT